MKKIKIDILGSCVLRDAVEFSSKARENLEVTKFFQNNSAITLGSAKLSDIIGRRIGPEEFSQTPPAWYRWFIANAEETVYDDLAASEAKWLFTSLIECFYGYYSFTNANIEARICPSFALQRNNILRKINFPYKSVSPLKTKIAIEETVTKHCERLKKIYKDKNIIFCDILPANIYMDKGKKRYFMNWDEYDRIIDFLKSVNEIFLKNMTNIYIIKMPENLLSDVNHKWGKGMQHFTSNIYQCIGDSLMNIINNTQNEI